MDLLMPYKIGLWLLLIGLLSACANTDSVNPSAISSRQTTVQGSAPIAAVGIDRARQMAIDDAIANASLQLKSSNSGPIQIGDIKVVDEWQDGNTYYVQVLTVRSEQKSCLSHYRKKIVATGFPFDDFWAD
jgi:type IV pilus biogenesis protein CpaD/CtpE